jgi:hypothetical protein
MEFAWVVVAGPNPSTSFPAGGARAARRFRLYDVFEAGCVRAPVAAEPGIQRQMAVRARLDTLPLAAAACLASFLDHLDPAL